MIAVPNAARGDEVAGFAVRNESTMKLAELDDSARVMSVTL